MFNSSFFDLIKKNIFLSNPRKHSTTRWSATKKLFLTFFFANLLWICFNACTHRAVYSGQFAYTFPYPRINIYVSEAAFVQCKWTYYFEIIFSYTNRSLISPLQSYEEIRAKIKTPHTRTALVRLATAVLSQMEASWLGWFYSFNLKCSFSVFFNHFAVFLRSFYLSWQRNLSFSCYIMRNCKKGQIQLVYHDLQTKDKAE